MIEGTREQRFSSIYNETLTMIFHELGSYREKEAETAHSRVVD